MDYIRLTLFGRFQSPEDIQRRTRSANNTRIRQLRTDLNRRTIEEHSLKQQYATSRDPQTKIFIAAKIHANRRAVVDIHKSIIAIDQSADGIAVAVNTVNQAKASIHTSRALGHLSSKLPSDSKIAKAGASAVNLQTKLLQSRHAAETAADIAAALVEDPDLDPDDDYSDRRSAAGIVPADEITAIMRELDAASAPRVPTKLYG